MLLRSLMHRMIEKERSERMEEPISDTPFIPKRAALPENELHLNLITADKNPIR